MLTNLHLCAKFEDTVWFSMCQLWHFWYACTSYFICLCQILHFSRYEKLLLAERGFDPRTSGLWAQHASTAPLCYHAKNKQILHFNNIKQKKIWHGGPYWVEKSNKNFLREKLFEKNFCQKWDSNPRPQKWTATWTQRLRPLGHPDSMNYVCKMWGVRKWYSYVLSIFS